MKKLMSLAFGTILSLSVATVAFAQDEKRDDNKERHAKKGEDKNKEPIISSSSKEKNVEVMLQIFSAIERRDLQRALSLFHPDVEFHWPPSLPYGGTSRGLKLTPPNWIETWAPLQPTDAERRLDPRIVAASEEEVVALWRQRGVSPSGDRIDTPVLSLYQLRQGKLARAQMFYFDTAAALSFLAKTDAGAQRRQATTSPVTAEAQAHGKKVTPDEVEWKPRWPGLEIAVLSGDPAKEGSPFVLRLKLRDGLIVPPHWHPVDEHLTVMTGTLHSGMGEKFDRAAATALPAGSYSLMPKDMRHFVWAEGETIIQLHGVGPFKTFWVNPDDDPTKKTGAN